MSMAPFLSEPNKAGSELQVISDRGRQQSQRPSTLAPHKQFLSIQEKEKQLETQQNIRADKKQILLCLCVVQI